MKSKLEVSFVISHDGNLILGQSVNFCMLKSEHVGPNCRTRSRRASGVGQRDRTPQVFGRFLSLNLYVDMLFPGEFRRKTGLKGQGEREPTFKLSCPPIILFQNWCYWFNFSFKHAARWGSGDWTRRSRWTCWTSPPSLEPSCGS